MRSIGKSNINKIRKHIILANAIGLSGIYEITEFVKSRLPQTVFDTWEGAYSEIERICHDIIIERS